MHIFAICKRVPLVTKGWNKRDLPFFDLPFLLLFAVCFGANSHNTHKTWTKPVKLLELESVIIKVVTWLMSYPGHLKGDI